MPSPNNEGWTPNHVKVWDASENAIHLITTEKDQDVQEVMDDLEHGGAGLPGRILGHPLSVRTSEACDLGGPVVGAVGKGATHGAVRDEDARKRRRGREVAARAPGSVSAG